MSLHSWFRKNNKYLMAGMVVLLMISFGLPMTAMVRRNPRQGQIRGEKVTLDDRYEPSVALGVLRSISAGMNTQYEIARDISGILYWRSSYLQQSYYQVMRQLQAVRSEDEPDEKQLEYLNERMRAIGQQLSFIDGMRTSGRATAFSAIYNFVFPQDGAGNYPDWWRALVLLREADAAEIVVTDADVEVFEEFVATCGAMGILNGSYVQVLTNSAHTPESIDLGRKALIKMFKLVEMRGAVVTTSTAELWAPYYATSISRTVDYVKLDADHYIDGVVPSESDLQAFYEQHKAEEMDPEGEKPGYTTPRRARLQVALVDMADVEASVQVTDEEALAYYDDEANDDEFRAAPETPVNEAQPEDGDDAGDGEDDAEDAADAPAEAAAAADDAAPAEADEPADDAAAADDADDVDDEAADGDEAEVAEPAPKMPFEEVKDDIIAKLTERKVREEATRRVQVAAPRSVNRLRDRQLYVLAQVAIDAGLCEPFVLGGDEGDGFLTKKEATELLPANGGGALGALFTEGAVPEETFEFAANADTPFVIKLLAVEEPRVLPLADVADLVAKHWRPVGAVAAAQERIDALVDEANETGLDEALMKLNGELELSADSAIQMQTSDKVTSRSPYVMAGAPDGIVGEIFDAEPGKWFAATPGTDAVFAVRAHEVADADAADEATREEFIARYDILRNQTLGGKRGVIVENWMQGLLDASTPDTVAIEKVEKEREEAADQSGEGAQRDGEASEETEGK